MSSRRFCSQAKVARKRVQCLGLSACARRRNSSRRCRSCRQRLAGPCITCGTSTEIS